MKQCVDFEVISLKKTSLPSFLNLPITEQDKLRISERLETLHFVKNETVFAQGEVCHQIYFIRSGLVKLSYLSLDGKEMIKSFITEGHMFGSLISQLTGGASAFNAVALEPLDVEVLDYAVLQHLIENNVELQKLLLRFFQQLALKKELREYELLCLSAQQRYQKMCDEEPQLVSRVKQADLALYLGITPIALSRLKHRRK